MIIIRFSCKFCPTLMQSGFMRLSLQQHEINQNKTLLSRMVHPVSIMTQTNLTGEQGAKPFISQHLPTRPNVDARFDFICNLGGLRKMRLYISNGLMFCFKCYYICLRKKAWGFQQLYHLNLQPERDGAWRRNFLQTAIWRESAVMREFHVEIMIRNRFLPHPISKNIHSASFVHD